MILPAERGGGFDGLKHFNWTLVITLPAYTMKIVIHSFSAVAGSLQGTQRLRTALQERNDRRIKELKVFQLFGQVNTIFHSFHCPVNNISIVVASAQGGVRMKLFQILIIPLDRFMEISPWFKGRRDGGISGSPLFVITRNESSTTWSRKINSLKVTARIDFNWKWGHCRLIDWTKAHAADKGWSRQLIYSITMMRPNREDDGE